MILNGDIWKALLKLKPTFSFNRPAILANGMWDQVRVDHGKEFYLTLFIQELLSPHRYTQERRPYLQTPSTRVQFSMFYSCFTNTHCGYPCWNYLLICFIVYFKTIICFSSTQSSFSELQRFPTLMISWTLFWQVWLSYWEVCKM